MRKFIFRYFILLMICGCSTSQVAFRSSPDKAEIFVRSPGGTAAKLLGQTPLSLSGSEFAKKSGVQGPVVVEFRKSGFQEEKFIISEVSVADVVLNVALRPRNEADDPEKLNLVIDRLFESQRLAQAGRYDEALKWLFELEKGNPQLAAIHELKGGIYLLQQRYTDALDAFTLAVKHNPSNTESLRIRNVLKERVGEVTRKIGSVNEPFNVNGLPEKKPEPVEEVQPNGVPAEGEEKKANE